MMPRSATWTLVASLLRDMDSYISLLVMTSRALRQERGSAVDGLKMVPKFVWTRAKVPRVVIVIVIVIVVVITAS